MPSDYHLGYYFFAPNGRFEPCGMFTNGHIISAVICIVVITLCLTKFKKIFFDKQRITRFTAILLTVLEIIKIAHSFIHNELNIDAWFPISYCGLFIFALWMSGYDNGILKKSGDAFIAYGCPVAGIAFLIFPTTSLMNFPIWHYLSLYSMIFHSIMIMFGICYLHHEKKLDNITYFAYAKFILLFATIAVIMNTQFRCNLMNLREPYNIPIEFLQGLYSNFSVGYTVFVIIAYMVIPILVAGLTNKIKFK